MFAFSRVGISLLMVVGNLMFINAQSVTYTIDELCSVVANNTKLANPADCHSYYTCTDGVATPATCDATLAYDQNGQKCVLASTTSCTTASSNPCEGQAVGTFVSNPVNCSAYYYCGANNVATAGNCPSGLDFSDGQCVYSSTTSCTDDPTTVTASDVCSFVPNALFFGSINNCTEYNVCSNGELQTGNCTYVFNIQTQSCDYTSNYACVVSEVPETITEDCVVDNSQTLTEALNVTNAPCNQYYTCVDGTQWLLQTCSAGEFYDTSNSECTVETAAVNPDCDRCTGHSTGFVVGVASCQDYFICENGQSYNNTEYPCPYDLYFNQTLQACVAPVVTYACCSSED